MDYIDMVTCLVDTYSYALLLVYDALLRLASVLHVLPRVTV